MSTICAISSPAGVGGVAVVRISGKDAIAIADSIWQGKRLKECTSHTAHLGWVCDSRGEQLDQCVATLFRGPKSFTGEDVVELGIHGSAYVQQEVVNSLIAHGCRMAEAGEFTRRAFSSGRIDLAEAEAVADVIASTSRAAHRLAVSQMRGDFSRKIGELHDALLDLASLLELELDFSDQEVEFASRERLKDIAGEVLRTVGSLAATFHRGQAFKEGIPTAIVGSTNVGKSTLLNRLLHDDRAIVSDIHGTTRDTIEDTAVIDGVMFRFIDTAGLRDTADTIEALGIERALERTKRARIVVLVGDSTDPEGMDGAWRSVRNVFDEIVAPPEERPTLLLVWNKIDLLDGAANSLSPDAREGNYHDQSGPEEQLSPDAREGNYQSELENQIARISTDIEEYCHHNGMESHTVRYSAKYGDDVQFEKALIQCVGESKISHGDIIVTNARHYQALSAARESIARVIDGLSANIPPEFVAQDLRATLSSLEEITGTISTPKILSTVFSRFCIGK